MILETSLAKKLPLVIKSGPVKVKKYLHFFPKTIKSYYFLCGARVCPTAKKTPKTRICNFGPFRLKFSQNVRNRKVNWQCNNFRPKKGQPHPKTPQNACKRPNKLLWGFWSARAEIFAECV